ncbi:MAG: tRNA (N(6)-L-threonylcarbamoyladenosine(37)-C(2))-methylthiotransferase MtaB [Candidatus Binatia bacterium]
MRVAITTLGCKVNQYDGAVIERLLDERGWTRVAFSDPADAYVINSCTVTARADADARRVGRRARRTNPEARIIMTGCYAQVSPEEVAALDYVDYVVGLGRLTDLLRAVEGELSRAVAVSDLRKSGSVETLGITSFPGRTRAFVKVEEGCDLFCTFCVIPLARGRSRSVSAGQVVDEIERLAATGYREVVLTGTHLGAWGAGFDPAQDLSSLLEAIARRGPAVRVRISSVDPPEISSRLLDVIAANPMFCQHFHVPLQACNDSVLAHMGRKYSLAEADRALAALRRRLPDACIGTDMISGFPGESEQEFRAGLDYLASSQINYVHVFPFSQRSSTGAAKRWPLVEPRIAHRRAALIRQLSNRLRRAFHDSFLERRVPMLVEKSRDPNSGLLRGYSANYLPLLLDGDDSLSNRLVDVRIRGHRGHRLEAVRV